MRNYVRSYMSKIKSMDLRDIEYHVWIPHIVSDDSQSQEDSGGDETITDVKEVYSEKESLDVSITVNHKGF
jgi:hypothetical protein